MTGSGRLITTCYYGGKNQPQIQDRILPLLDVRTAYLEPFCGSAGIILNRIPVRAETINDIDKLVVNFFKVLRDRPDDLVRSLSLTPYAREEQSRCCELLADPDALDEVERARCWYGATALSLAGETGGRYSIPSPQTGKNSALSYSHRVHVTLLEVAKRLLRVQIENRDAVDLIEDVRMEDCTIYCDPPYMRETRNYAAGYLHDGTDDLHERLLDAVVDHPAQVVISTYDNDYYRERLAGWHKFDVPVAKRAAAPPPRTDKREMPRAVETIYCNQLPQVFPEFLDGLT